MQYSNPGAVDKKKVTELYWKLKFISIASSKEVVLSQSYMLKGGNMIATGFTFWLRTPT